MRISTLSILGGAAVAALVGGAVVPLVVDTISGNSSVARAVERACLPSATTEWDGLPALVAMAEAARPRESELEPFTYALCEGVRGEALRARARDYLEAVRDPDGRLVYERYPGPEPRGSEPFFSGETAEWMRHDEVWDPMKNTPDNVVGRLMNEALALLTTGELAAGTRALEAAYGFTRVLSMGHASPGDQAVVLAGVRAARNLDSFLAESLEALPVPPATFRRIHEVVRADGRGHRPLTAYVGRDHAFRRQAIDVVRRWMGPLRVLEPLLWSDPERDLRRIRRSWFVGTPPRPAELAGTHPVIAGYLPDLARLRGLELRVAEGRSRLLHELLFLAGRADPPPAGS